MQNEDMADRTPATKGQLAATAADLKGLFKSDLAATKAELKADLAATAADLKRLFKSDLAATKAELKADLAANETAIRTELKETTRRLSKEIVATQTNAAKLKDELMHFMRRMQSNLLNQMDGFMTKTRKVDVDQVFLIHRMDKLEKRVGSLEARAP